MGKPNNIRKRALDLARKQQWDKALVEFERLIDIEQNNPNVHNEVGDIYLKLGNKREAFKSFHTAVDAYSRVSLNNNAVAVCKKILRLNPNDQIVYGKLAKLRHKQGFHREATTHALTFLDKILDVVGDSGDRFRDLVMEITLAAGDAADTDLLERAAQYLMKCKLNDDAGTILEKLDQIYAAQGMTAQRELVQKHMESIGYMPTSVSDPNTTLDKLETVESARDHFAGGPDGFVEDFDESSIQSVSGDRSTGAVEEYGMVDLITGGEKNTSPIASGEGDMVDPVTPDATRPQEGTGSDGIDGGESAVTSTMDDLGTESPDDPSRDAYAPTDPQDDAEADPIEGGGPSTGEMYGDDGVSGGEDGHKGGREWVIPAEETHPEIPNTGLDGETHETGGGDGVGIVGQLSSEVTADIDDEDHRSHYDLGMAYLEMNLLPEAIREFQFASSSSMYQIRSLEMIGRCFIKQDKPQLAIKQLTRGLALVGDDDRDSLGIRYSLGIAHEMVGDLEKAKSFFEDVYVVDVTFRDVEEKMRNFNS